VAALVADAPLAVLALCLTAALIAGLLWAGDAAGAAQPPPHRRPTPHANRRANGTLESGKSER
jgi:hypothetical protein